MYFLLPTVQVVPGRLKFSVVFVCSQLLPTQFLTEGIGKGPRSIGLIMLIGDCLIFSGNDTDD